MRQITRAAAYAFKDGRNMSRQNMTISHDPFTGSRMLLHGNLIAIQDSDGLRMTLAGWNTPTTRERLNGLLFTLGKDGFFSQHEFGAYYNGREIESDEWITIT